VSPLPSLTTTQLPVFVPSPITIVKQNGTTVTFNISNPFTSMLRALYVQYESGLDVDCLGKMNMSTCVAPLTITATCTAGRSSGHDITKKFAIVDFFLVDPVLIKVADNATIPPCCHPEAGLPKTSSAIFSYKVYCETKCPVTSTTRNLRASRP